MDLAKHYVDLAQGLDGFLNLEPLLSSIQSILNDYLPAVYLIAFVLLVVATMREFLFPETRRFMQNLLRALLLVAAIGFLPSFIDWCDQGFKALADLPATQTISFGDSSYAIKSTNGSTLTAIEQVLQSKIAVSKTGEAAYAGTGPSAPGSPQFSLNPLDLGKNVETVWKYVISRGVNLVWQRSCSRFTSYVCCFVRSSLS